MAAVSTRFMIRKVKLPYLPRMAVLIWAVVMVVLGFVNFTQFGFGPIGGIGDLSGVIVYHVGREQC